MFTGSNPSKEEIYMFFLDLANLYSTTGSLLTALEFLMEQVEHPKLKAAIKDMKKTVHEGSSVSEAMKTHAIFPSFCSQLVYAGEESGSLDKILIEIGRDLSQTGDIEKRINAALLPVKIVLGIVTVSFLVACFWVLPKFQTLYVELKIELPFITRFVLGLGSVLVQYWHLLLVGAVVCSYLFKWYKRTHQEKFDKLVFKIPLYGEIYYYRLQYRFVKMLGLLYKAGISPGEGLEYIALSVNNVIFSRVLRNAAKEVTKGTSISNSLKHCNFEKMVDKLVINCIATGEISGKLDHVLFERADYYDGTVLRYKIQQFSEKIGPLFLSPMMFLILGLLIAVYYPMFMMNSAIK